MIPKGELQLISSWTTPTTHGRPYYIVLYDKTPFQVSTCNLQSINIALKKKGWPPKATCNAPYQLFACPTILPWGTGWERVME